MPPDKLDQLDVDIAASLGGFVAAPDAEGYESRLMQLLGQRDELLAADESSSKGLGRSVGSPTSPYQSASVSGFSPKAAKDGGFLERCKVDRRHRQEALTAAPLPCVQRPLHERLWEQVEAYRSPTPTERVHEELYEFLRSRLSSLQVMHGQMVRHFSQLAASPLTNLTPGDFEAFQAQASWHEAVIQKASAACIRLDSARAQNLSPKPLFAGRSPLRSPNSSRWEGIPESETDGEIDALGEELRGMLQFCTYEQACVRRVRQLLFRLEWLPVSEWRRVGEQVRQRLTDGGQRNTDGGQKATDSGQRNSDSWKGISDSRQKILDSGMRNSDSGERSSDSGLRNSDSEQKITDSGHRITDKGRKGTENGTRIKQISDAKGSSSLLGLPREPLTLEEVDARLQILAVDFGFEADWAPFDAQKVPSDEKLPNSLEAQGTQLAMRVKDVFSELFDGQERKAQLKPYPAGLLAKARRGGADGRPEEEPGEFDRDAFHLVREATDSGNADTQCSDGAAPMYFSRAEASLPRGPSEITGQFAMLSASTGENESTSKRDAATPEDELVHFCLSTPLWAHNPGHQAWLRSVGEVDTCLKAELEFLHVSSREEATVRIQEMAKQHSRLTVDAGIETLKRQFLQTAKAAAAAQQVRTETEGAKPKPLLIPESERERSSSAVSTPKTPKKGATHGQARPLSGRARAETVPAKLAPPKALTRMGSGARPQSSAGSVEEDPGNEQVPGRKLETLYSLQFLKSRRLRLRLLHSVNVLHSVRKRLAEDVRNECRSDGVNTAAARVKIQQLVERYVSEAAPVNMTSALAKMTSPVPSLSALADVFPSREAEGSGGVSKRVSAGNGHTGGVVRNGRNSNGIPSGSKSARNSVTVRRPTGDVAHGAETERSNASHRYSDVSVDSDVEDYTTSKPPLSNTTTRRSSDGDIEGYAASKPLINGSETRKSAHLNQGRRKESQDAVNGALMEPEACGILHQSEDRYDFDPVLGCRTVRDWNGLRAVYSGALTGFDELSGEVVRIATGFVNEETERLNDQPAESADARGIDRRAVLLEFLELEAKYMAAKLELVLALLAAYQHSLSCPEGAARLRSEILGVIAHRLSFAVDSTGRGRSFRHVYEDEIDVMRQSLQIATSVMAAQMTREKELIRMIYVEGTEVPPSVGLPCPPPASACLAPGTPFPSVSLVGNVIRAVRTATGRLARQLQMGDCAHAQRALRAQVLQRTWELWEALQEEPRIRKGLVSDFEPPGFASSPSEHLKESLIMDNPAALDATVTSCLPLPTGGPPGSDEFDHVGMTPTAVSLDGFRSPSRVHQSLPATDHSFGRMRSATEPHVGGISDTSDTCTGRSASASVSDPRPLFVARTLNSMTESLAVNTSQGAFSPGPAPISYHNEPAPATMLDLISRAVEIQRLRSELVRALQETEVLEGFYEVQASALGVAVRARAHALEALLVQDGLGVLGKPQRALRDLEGEVKVPPEDVEITEAVTVRGPKPAIAELDVDLLELDFHTSAGVQDLLASADGASKLRLTVQAQLAHNCALTTALRNNGILLDAILRSVHHKRRLLVRKNVTEAGRSEIGIPPKTAAWGDFEATLHSQQQLLRSPSKGWKEKGPVGLRPEQEEELREYRGKLSGDLGDLFLSVNVAKNHVRVGILESFNKKLQQAIQKKGVGPSLRKAKADLKAELVEEYVKSIFQELAPFCRSSELAGEMNRLGRLLLSVNQTGETFAPGGPVPSSSNALPLFPSPLLLQQAALDFGNLWGWLSLGPAGEEGIETDASSQSMAHSRAGNTGPGLMRSASPTDGESEDSGLRDSILEGHRRFGLNLLDENGKLAQLWACYAPLEALRMAAVKGLGVSEIGEGADAVGALADILKVRWATLFLALPEQGPRGGAAGRHVAKASSALEVAAREAALAAAQKCKGSFWAETHGLKEEAEHVRLKSGGKAAVCFLQLKRTIAYWRHVLVLQAARDQFTKAGNARAARGVARLIADSTLAVERSKALSEDTLPRHIAAQLIILKEDALGKFSSSLHEALNPGFLSVKGSAALDLPKSAGRPLSRALTLREAKPSNPGVDTWLVGPHLPAQFLNLSVLSDEERKAVVVEDKKLEHSLEMTLEEDRGYAQTLPIRVGTKTAYHLELRLVHTSLRSAFFAGEEMLFAVREGRPEQSSRPGTSGSHELRPNSTIGRPTTSGNPELPQPASIHIRERVSGKKMRPPGWFPRQSVLTSADQAELFQRLVVRPLGDVSFKAAESAREGGARLIVRPPAAATKELSGMEAEVWKMKHIIDRHCLEATTLSLEAECTQLLASRGRRDCFQRDAIFKPSKAASEFVEELSALGVFTSEDGPSFRGGRAIREEEDGEKEQKVREAAEGFVERLVTQAARQQELVQAAVHARVQELSRSLLARQEDTWLAEWERQQEQRQYTAMKEAEICDRGLGMVSELDFLRRKLARMDARVDDYARRVCADVEAECAEQVAGLEKELAVQRSNFEVFRKDMNNDMLQAFADIKNETVMKIMSYRGEDGHPPPAGVSPQLRMLQMEAELQEQRAENADLRASITKINTMSKLRVLTLSSKFNKSVRAVRQERSVLDLEAWEARERAQSEGRALREQLAATRAALAKSEEELRESTKELAHVKRTKSKLLHWKVQNSPALGTLEQHDTRIAQKVEAKQAAKLQRLSTMASAFGREGVEELEAVRTSEVFQSQDLILAQIRTPIEGFKLEKSRTYGASERFRSALYQTRRQRSGSGDVSVDPIRFGRPLWSLNLREHAQSKQCHRRRKTLLSELRIEVAWPLFPTPATLDFLAMLTFKKFMVVNLPDSSVCLPVLKIELRQQVEVHENWPCWLILDSHARASERALP